MARIPAARVPLIDKKTGLISREWYQFFFQDSFAQQLSLGVLHVYADNAAAKADGLVAGDFYQTSIGQLMIVY